MRLKLVSVGILFGVMIVGGCERKPASGGEAAPPAGSKAKTTDVEMKGLIPAPVQLSNLELTVLGPNKKAISGARVFVVPDSVRIRKVLPQVKDSYHRILEALVERDDGVAPWGGTEGKPGVPDTGALRSIRRLAASEVLMEPMDASASWTVVVATIMAGASRPDGPTNITQLPQAFENLAVPLLEDEARMRGKTNAGGKVAFRDLASGSYEIVTSASTSNGYYLWVTPVKVEKGEPKILTLSGPALYYLELKRATP